MTNQSDTDRPIEERIEALGAELEAQDALVAEAMHRLGLSLADVDCLELPAEAEALADAIFEREARRSAATARAVPPIDRTPAGVPVLRA